uniref:PH domain-containing protein n=1 Tax=Pyramimonas obovata TaxID=1411642 RepID=A0A7S0N6R1_9CHLO|mmetsp:Transcript_22056/g.48405  ORF Transcript_22056/g.48405 Transcript_22056/m.48405 type:complete len:142 (+) Transcript_22056:127-552(+)
MGGSGWLSYGRPESGNVREGLVHEGWLKKKRTSFPHTWQRRYFLLLVVPDSTIGGAKKLTVEYYEKAPQMKHFPSGAINLSKGLTWLTCLEDTSGCSFAFEAFQNNKNRNRRFDLQADNPETSARWVQALSEAVQSAEAPP